MWPHSRKFDSKLSSAGESRWARARQKHLRAGKASERPGGGRTYRAAQQERQVAEIGWRQTRTAAPSAKPEPKFVSGSSLQGGGSAGALKSV